MVNLTSNRRNYEELEFWFRHDMYLSARILYLGSASDSSDDTNYVTSLVTETIIKGLIVLEADDQSAPITIIMNTLGGDLYNAMAIYDTIKTCSCPVIIKAYGACMSAGTIILQAADQRLLSPNSTFMIHDGSDGFEGNSRDFEKWAENSKHWRKKIYSIYASRSGKPTKFWDKMCVNDTIMTATQAVELGLADKVLKYSSK